MFGILVGLSRDDEMAIRYKRLGPRRNGWDGKIKRIFVISKMQQIKEHLTRSCLKRNTPDICVVTLPCLRVRFNFREHWADSDRQTLGQPRSVSRFRPHFCGVSAAIQASCLQCQQRKQGKWKNIYCIARKGDCFFFPVISLSSLESKLFSRKSPADFPNVSCSEQYQMPFPWRRKEYYLNWQDKWVISSGQGSIINYFLK